MSSLQDGSDLIKFSFPIEVFDVGHGTDLSTYSGGQIFLDTKSFPIESYSKQVMQNLVLW